MFWPLVCQPRPRLIQLLRCWGLSAFALLVSANPGIKDQLPLLSCRSLQLISHNPVDRSPPGSSVLGILQARILEWVAMPPPGDLPAPSVEPTSPALGERFWEAHSLSCRWQVLSGKHTSPLSRLGRERRWRSWPVTLRKASKCAGLGRNAGSSLLV